MKKLLLILALAWAAHGAMNNPVWDGSSSSNWSTADNWTASGVPAAADSVVLNAGAVNCSLSTASVCSNFTSTSGYTGIFKMPAGNKLTVGGKFIYDGTAISLADTLQVGGQSTASTLHLGTTLTSTSISSCVADMTSSGLFDIDEPLAYLKVLKAGYVGKTVTVTSAVGGGGTAFLSMQGGTINITNPGVLYIGKGNESSPFWSGTATIGGDYLLFPQALNTTAQIDTLPAITTGGTTTLQITKTSGAGTIVFQITGAISVPNLTGLNGANVACTLNTLGNAITATTLHSPPNSNGASGSFVANYGASTVNVGVWKDTVGVGTGDNVMLQTATITATGNVSLKKTGLMNSGTSVFNLTGGGTQAIKSFGKILYDVVQNGAGTVSLVDSMQANDLTVTTGIFTANGQAIRLSGDVAFGGTGNLTLNKWITQTAATSSFAITTSGTITSVACSLDIQGSSSINVNDKKVTFGRIVLGNGKTYTMSGGDTIAVGKNVAGDWSGTAGNVTTMTATSTWYLNAPAGVTVSYMAFKNCNASGGSQIVANDGSSTDLGGNSNILFPSGNQGGGYKNNVTKNRIYKNRIYKNASNKQGDIIN